jgi:hypothetical protein
MNNNEHLTAQIETSKKFLKVQGILSIAFGGLGTLFGIPIIFIYALSASYDMQSDVGPVVFIVLLTLGLIFWMLPHIFLVVSGATLVRSPKPSVAKGMTIANLVVGAFWNYILLAFAIVSLVQSGNYARGYGYKPLTHHYE